MPGDSIWRRAANYAASTAAHVLAGMPQTEPSVRRRRLEVCGVCPHLVQPSKVCGVCSCYVEKKSMRAGEHCPIGKWEDSPSFFFMKGEKDYIVDPRLSPVPDNWRQDVNVMQRHVAAFAELGKRVFVAPPMTQGDGILTCGGGKLWPMIVVQVAMLRKTGCQLPVSIWHRGSTEPVYPADLAGLGDCTIVDWEKVDLGYVPRSRGGWEQKLIAIAGTSYRRILFLDADAYCVCDPAPLFALADQTGFAFWADLPVQRRTFRPQSYGLDPVDLPPVQGGQIVIDREKAWRLIAVTQWLCQHSDWSFGPDGSGENYGDQDQWRAAMALTGMRGTAIGDARLAYPSLVCGHERQDYIVHRCSAKLLPPWTGAKIIRYAHLPQEDAALEAFATAIGKTPGDRFRKLVFLGGWGAAGASAGGGREADEQPFIRMVNTLLKLAQCHTLVDLGSGDGQVLRQLRAERRIAVDAVPLPFLADQADEGIEWVQRDLTCPDTLPGGDIATMRDVLHHWPTQAVADWLSWAARTGPWRWLILSMDCTDEKGVRTCDYGGWAPINATMQAFGAPPLAEVCRFGQKRIFLLRCAKDRPQD